MIGLFNFFFKYYWTNVLHVTFYTTIDLGAHFYRYFYETTDRCKSYLDQQIEHEIWFSRQLVWQYWQKYQTHSHNDTEILINALWHTSPSANNRHIKCHTIIFSYNILAIPPPPSHKKKYDMNDIWFKNDNNWNHFNNYTRKKIHSNIHLPRAKTLACHLEEAGHKKNLAYTLKNI